MEDLIKDEIIGELKYLKSNNWGKRLDSPVLNSDGNLILKVQDTNKEGILDIQREAYKTYLQNEEKYKSCVTDYLLDYYKWNNEVFMNSVSGIDETYHKDVITEEKLFTTMTLWYLFICRDGSFGYAFGCCCDKENGLAVLLSESEPRVISRTQLENLHKLNDPTLGLLVHDGKKAWKGLEVNKFFGKPENLEIELEGGVDEGITPAQQKAYEKYLQNKEEYFKEFSKMLLRVYVGSEEKGEALLSKGVEIGVQTVLPKTLYIDRKGNYGWSCYTDWNKGYVDVLLSKDRPYLMEKGGLACFSTSEVVIDKEMGLFFPDFIGLSSVVIVRLAGKVRTLPFSIDISEGERAINDDMREAYQEYVKLNATFWEEIQDISLDYYLDMYDEFEPYYNLPDSLKKENVNRDTVMSLMQFTKLYMTSEGRIAWLCESPLMEEDGLGFEFTSGEIELIGQPEII